MIDLYSWGTPNGWKASIALEELELEYTLYPVSLIKGVQKDASFLKLNPNGRIPVIVDQDEDKFVVFESGAILIYLAEKTGRLLPPTMKARSEVLQWLMFQMSGVGPMMGQAGVFKTFFPEKIPSVIARYEKESRRLLSILDGRLLDREYLCGDFSIADIATWPWARTYRMLEFSIDDFPNLSRWLNQMAGRPACQRGIERPPFTPPSNEKNGANSDIVIR